MNKASAVAQTGSARITDLTHDGRGVADDGGKRLFVAGALIGETVDYRRIRKRRRHDEADTLAVVEPSPHRVVPRCPVFGVCGGCSLQHLEHEQQIVHKQRTLIENLRRIGGVAAERILPPLTGPAWNYRRKARLGVKYVTRKERVLVGFRERLKPYIVDMRDCPILVTGADALPGLLSDLISELTIRSEVPQVELAVGDSDRALVFRVLRPPEEADLDKLADFGVEHAFSILLQTGGPATVRSLARYREASAAPAGEELHYTLDDLVFTFRPTDFVQVNSEINRRLVALAVDKLAVGAGHRVLDLFCGIGNFSLPLARRAGEVLGLEGADDLVERARANACANRIDNVRFELADLERLSGSEAWCKEHFDRVLLDPARAGCEEVLPLIAGMAPGRVVYVSCHPGTLARDIGRLVNDYGYRLSEAGIIDMFPHTAHVESIAVLEKM